MTNDARKNKKGYNIPLTKQNATTGQNWPLPIITANKYGAISKAKNNYNQPAPLIQP